jgi:hypothetical protein
MGRPLSRNEIAKPLTDLLAERTARVDQVIQLLPPLLSRWSSDTLQASGAPLDATPAPENSTDTLTTDPAGIAGPVVNTNSRVRFDSPAATDTSCIWHGEDFQSKVGRRC